jgi:hypothetical protein
MSVKEILVKILSDRVDQCVSEGIRDRRDSCDRAGYTSC